MINAARKKEGNLELKLYDLNEKANQTTLAGADKLYSLLVYLYDEEKLESRLVDEKKEGNWVYYFKDGKTIRAKGAFINDKQNGKWLEHDGKTIDYYVVKNYKSGELIFPKQFKAVYLTGETHATCKIVNKKFSGEFKKYYKTGKLKSKVNYIKGVLEGEVKEYYSNGKLAFLATYKKDKQVGDTKEFSIEGVLTRKISYNNNNNNIEVTKYYKNGKVDEISNYTNKKLNGIFKSFYRDGNISKIGTYLDNKKVGEWKEYNSKAGRFKSIINYNEEGKENGVYKIFDYEGEISQTGTYNNGIKIGEWKRYYGENISELINFNENGEKMVRAKGEQFFSSSLAYIGRSNKGQPGFLASS